MQKEPDMGKAHWLSKPTLVGALSLSTSAQQDPRSRGVVPTHSPCVLPETGTQLLLGQEIAPPHQCRGGCGPGCLYDLGP